MIARSAIALIFLMLAIFRLPVSMADDALVSKFREVSDSPYSLDFELIDQAGTVWRLSQLRGQVVVINFWATWCAPCLKELPSMQALSTLFEDESFSLLAINAGEEPIAIDRFIENFDPPLDFPILSDPNMQAAGEWGVRGLPTTYIVNRHGRLLEFAEGEIDFTNNTLVEKLQRLIDGGR